MTRNDNPTDRTEVDNAHVSIFLDETPDAYRMVVPTDDDLSIFDLGDLVGDRIEANGRVTMPDDNPAPGEREPLGEVYWDDRGIPTRLDLDDGGVIVFTENGGYDKTLGDDV